MTCPECSLALYIWCHAGTIESCSRAQLACISNNCLEGSLTSQSLLPCRHNQELQQSSANIRQQGLPQTHLVFIKSAAMQAQELEQSSANMHQQNLSSRQLGMTWNKTQELNRFSCGVCSHAGTIRSWSRACQHSSAELLEAVRN